MNVTRKEQRIIQRALNAWQASGELTPADSQRLAHTLRVSPFDWRRLSRYAFWTALACVLIALGSLFADSELVAWLLSLFSHSALTRILLPALLAVACYGWGFRRQQRETQWHYSTEAILLLKIAMCCRLLFPISAPRWPSTVAIRHGKTNWRAFSPPRRSLKRCGISATRCAAWKTRLNILTTRSSGDSACSRCTGIRRRAMVRVCWSTCRWTRRASRR